MPSQVDAPAAERLLRARERAGYSSAREVAEAFGWPDYPMDESGERALLAARAKLYAHAFHVDPGWLLSGDGEAYTGSDEADDASSEPPRPGDELAERIGRLTDAQRAALLEFLRAMQAG
jgi:transcriptional regulator with XRE-family HTH domain